MHKHFYFHSGLILTIMSLMLSCLCQAKAFPSYPPPPSIPYHNTTEIFRNGINVIITLDSFCQRWGVKIEQLEDAAQTGVRAAGWDFNPSSEIDITVSIDSMMPRNDSIYALKIETGRTRKTIDMKKNEMGLLS
ncbi:MAG: hypothetical protein HY800_00880, partial [Ignavibacteriales bacterium]|nr:hypothetical protein [Ignavibacteriales bacterium]